MSITQLRTAFLSKQFAVFLLVGGFAAFVNFTSRIGFSVFLPYPVAIVAAYVVGMITAYVLNRWIVFASTAAVWSEPARFVLVNVLAVLQTFAISLLLNYIVLPWLGVAVYREEIAHACGVCVPVFTSYLGHKYWTFGKTRAEADAA